MAYDWSPEAVAARYAEQREKTRLFVEPRRLKLAALKKERGCARCAEKDPRCLEFHHRDPKTKTTEVSGMVVFRKVTWEMIEQEIAKCDVLCRNCHAKEHRDPIDV